MISQMLGLSLMLLSVVLALEGAPRFKIGGRWVEFRRQGGTDAALVHGCDRDCQALNAKSKSRPAAARPKRGGANPGALACERVGGAVVVGIDAPGNENSFCLFKDGSMIGVAALETD